MTTRITTQAGRTLRLSDRALAVLEEAEIVSSPLLGSLGTSEIDADVDQIRDGRTPSDVYEARTRGVEEDRHAAWWDYATAIGRLALHECDREHADLGRPAPGRRSRSTDEGT